MQSYRNESKHSDQLLYMSVQIISAQQLPKLNKDNKRSIVDPLVRVEIYGVPDDNASKQTHHIEDNGKCQPCIYIYAFSKHFLFFKPKCRSLKCFFLLQVSILCGIQNSSSLFMCLIWLWCGLWWRTMMLANRMIWLACTLSPSPACRMVSR